MAEKKMYYLLDTRRASIKAECRGMAEMYYVLTRGSLRGVVAAAPFKYIIFPDKIDRYNEVEFADRFISRIAAEIKMDEES